MKTTKTKFHGYFIIVLGIILLIVFSLPKNSKHYVKGERPETLSSSHPKIEEKQALVEKELEKRRHISTPERVRAIYMSSWVGGERQLRGRLLDFIDRSSINALVLDIKDYSGVIAFDIDDPLIDRYATDGNRIPDIVEFLDELHDHDIYVIGRLTVFQDPLFAQARPDLAFKRVDNGEVWTDDKGLAFLNPREEEVWEYMARIAEASYALGFDEINFDYIRFPSDGNMQNLNYGLKEGELRTDVMKSFYVFLDERLRSQGIPISADLFGMTTSNEDDLSIGQDIEDALPHFDFIAPMVYPSHYPPSFLGYNNPADYPYEVVHYAMSRGKERAIAIGEDPLKLRTWIQDFDLGASYDMSKIIEQIQATYDAGLNSYMVWDPKNRYTQEAYMSDIWKDTE